MDRHGEGPLLPAAWLVGQLGVSGREQRGAAALFPGDNCPCGRPEAICTRVCPYGCTGIAVRVKMLWLCCKYVQTLKKGPWAPGLYVFKTESRPARPGMLLSGELGQGGGAWFG